MNRWEYMILTFGGPEVNEVVLNRYGDEGWELVSVLRGTTNGVPSLHTVWKRKRVTGDVYRDDRSES